MTHNAAIQDMESKQTLPAGFALVEEVGFEPTTSVLEGHELLLYLSLTRQGTHSTTELLLYLALKARIELASVCAHKPICTSNLRISESSPFLDESLLLV